MSIKIAGVDEAGRGPLAGNVVAAAVILDPHNPIKELADSKCLSAAKREELSLVIKSNALAWSVASASVSEIDKLNIFWATMLAMQRAVKQLPQQPELVKVDGKHCPELDCETIAIIGGDALVAEISAASILAKTARDFDMLQLHHQFPQYRFDQHKGYPTKLHKQMLKQYGVSPHHRRSYAPVRAILASKETIIDE